MGPPPALGRCDIKKILIRATNWIGDAVMTTPAMDALRKAFPGAELVVVANPIVAELFCSHPCCDRVIVFDKKRISKGLRGLLQFSKQLRLERFDLAVLFQNAIEAALMAFLARIPLRAGYSTDGRGFLLTHRVPVGPVERSLHHTAYYCGMLERLGIEAKPVRLGLNCTADETAWARNLLHGKRWAAINPGAAYGSAKRWIPERFAAVADAIARDFDMSILLTGGKNEQEIGSEIAKHMTIRPLNVTGKTSVRQLMALLSCCDLMVTNDSGPMHIAAAFGIPIVALFGPTDHTTTSPLSSNNRIVRKSVECAPCLKRSCPGDHGCMMEISVKDVLDAVRQLLEEHPRALPCEQ